MDRRQIEELLERYRNNLCTPEEREWLELLNMEQVKELENHEDEGDSREVWAAIQQHIAASKHRNGRKMTGIRVLRTAAAVALVFIISAIGIYTIVKKRNAPVPTDQVRLIEDLEPGGNKAFLILADGKRISLDSAGSGTLAQQSGMTIRKTEDDQLIYDASTSSSLNNESPVFNTIVTPKGGQYQVVLPDGSKVWLNAASSLTFPTSFSGTSTRTVELKGEAYFEVTHRANQPFVLNTQMQQLEVLGTHFNVNAYSDERTTRTTLLSGSVRISTKTNKRILKPDQQAILLGQDIQVQAADPTATSWKSGTLEFNRADLPTILREAARWYDFELIYDGAVTSGETMSVSIPRDSKLSTLLSVLKGMGVEFRMEQGSTGARLIVTGEK